MHRSPSQLLYRAWPALALLVLLSGTPAQALTLGWTAPTTNLDGSPLTDLAYYRLYYRAPGTVPWVLVVGAEVAATVLSVTVSPPVVGDYVVRAVNSAGVESDNSNIHSVKKPSRITTLHRQ